MVKKLIELPTKEVDPESLIDKGAKVKADIVKEYEPDWFYVKLRMPTDMVRAIDKRLKNCVGIRRTGWILQAIMKELNDN